MEEYKNGCPRNCTLKSFKVLLKQIEIYGNEAVDKNELYDMICGHIMNVIDELEEK